MLLVKIFYGCFFCEGIMGCCSGSRMLFVFCGLFCGILGNFVVIGWLGFGVLWW